MSRTVLTVCASVGLYAVFAAGSASASIYIDHGTGLIVPHTTITFSEAGYLAPNAIITNQFAGFGVTFTPVVYANTPDTLYANIVGDRIQNYYPCCNGSFSMLFSSVETAVDFNFVTQGLGDPNGGAGATTTFTAKLGAVTQASFSSSTDLHTTNNFYGFQGISFNRIDVSVVSVNNAFQLDNLQLVPEPSFYGMLALGLAGLAAAVRRRKKA